jgi:hypothetical protein
MLGGLRLFLQAIELVFVFSLVFGVGQGGIE